jgi:PAS domain S-box-containing protein
VLAAWLAGAMSERGATRLTVKTNTALCLLLLGVGLACVIEPRVRGWRRVAAGVCSVLLVVIGALTALENVWGVDVGIDQLIAREPPGALGVLAPNRPGLPASVGLTCGGAALLLLVAGGRAHGRLAHIPAAAMFAIGLLALIGYAFDAQPLYGVTRYTAIAWPTAAGLVLGSVGIACARPASGWVARVVADDPGGALLRWLVVPVALLLAGLGWLTLAGQRWGWHDAAMGTAILVFIAILTYTSLAYFVAGRLSESARALASVAQFATENPNPVLRLERTGRVLFANLAGGRLIEGEGWRARGPVGEPLRELIAAAFEHGGSREFDFRCRLGEIVSFTAFAVPQRGYVNLFGRDVTDARRAEEALRTSEARLRATFHSAGVGIVEMVDDDHFIAANDRACEILGRAREELLAMNVRELTWPEDRELSDRVNAEIHAGGRDRIDYEKRYIRGDGAPVWCHITVSAVRDEAGRWARSITTIQDIGARKAAESALRESENFYRQTIDSIPGMVFTTQPDGLCDYVSAQWVEFTGVVAEDQHGAGWMRLLHPDDAARAHDAWRAAVAGDAPYDLEYRVRRRDGEYEWFQVRGRPIREAGGAVARWFGVATSIDAIKRAEDALQAARRSAERARAEAEQANRAKDHFLAVLSHELRTPLMPVLTAVGLLLERADDPATVQQLEIVRRNVELEARLIDDLLDVTKIARGKLVLQCRPLRLCEVMQRAVEVCQPDIEARQLEFSADSQNGTVVHGDPIRLQQVFWNLLRNAVKFTPPGGRVALHCRREGGEAVVEVTDTGIGIAPEHLPRLFSPFEQGDRAITRRFGGLGLGLTISKALVGLHGGRLEAFSGGTGQGATFRVRLPLANAAAQSTPPPTGAGARGPQRGLRILLVEDHADTAKIMRLLLARSGHAVVHAADVAAALALASEGEYDLLISDLGLPDASGLDLIRELRRRGNALRGIALSGYGQEDDVARSRAAGFSTHLVKPITPEELARAIEEVGR